MKKIFINMAACALVLASLSCKKEKEETVIQETTLDTMATPAPEKMDTINADTMASAEATNPGNSSVAVTTHKTTRTVKTVTTSTSQTGTKPGYPKPKKDLTGYSAPNGTDAENRDGDTYTKNDTTVVPAGRPRMK